MMRMFYKALIFVLFTSGMVLAQFRTANLTGTVANEAGVPLGDVGIKVTFLTPSRDFVGPTMVREVWSGVTKEDGDYKVPDLLLGSYQVEASSAGFYTNFRWVPLRTSADEMILDITLKSNEISEAVPREVALPVPENREPIDEPVPVVTNGSQRISPVARRSQPPVQSPAAEPPPTEEPPSSQRDFTDSRSVGLAIQIAAFQTRRNAEGLQAKLQDAGFDAYVVETDVPSESARYYRVRVGPFDTREEARGVASNVQSRFPQQIPDYWIVSY
jgi:cell division septation protein DedD